MSECLFNGLPASSTAGIWWASRRPKSTGVKVSGCLCAQYQWPCLFSDPQAEEGCRGYGPLHYSLCTATGLVNNHFYHQPRESFLSSREWKVGTYFLWISLRSSKSYHFFKRCFLRFVAIEQTSLRSLYILSPNWDNSGAQGNTSNRGKQLCQDNGHKQDHPGQTPKVNTWCL